MPRDHSEASKPLPSLEQLPSLRVRSLLHASGQREIWSSEIGPGSQQVARVEPVVLERGATMRIERRAPAVAALSDPVPFSVRDRDEGRPIGVGFRPARAKTFSGQDLLHTGRDRASLAQWASTASTSGTS